MPSVIDVRALRRRPLYPTELRGLIQKIFNFAWLQDSNDSIFRRLALYPTELQTRMIKIFYPFGSGFVNA